MNLEDRINRLNGKLNETLAWGVIITIVVFLFIGWILGAPCEDPGPSLEARRRIIAGDVTAKTIAVQQLELFDADGNTVGRMSVDKLGSGQFALKDSEGNLLFHFFRSQAKESTITMHGPDGQIGAIIAVDEHSRGHLTLMNGNGKASITATTFDNGAGGVCVGDADGDFVGGLGPHPEGGGEVFIVDKNGTQRLSAMVNQSTSGSTAKANAATPR